MQPSDNVANHALFFMSGSMFALLISIFDATRRTAMRLLVGCLVGGIGASVAGQIFEGSRWQLLAAGIAAVITENMAMGLLKASREFSDHPFAVFGLVWKTISPTFGFGKNDA